MNKLIDNKVQEGDNLNSKFEVASSLFGKGGLLEPKDEWDKLSMAAKAEMMRVAVNHGIYDLQTIRQKYNEFAEGGDTNPYTVGATVDALYASNPREEFLGEPAHHYDFTQSEEWANEHGYYPDARGHRDDRVKKPAHPSHPFRGTWKGDKFELTDLGMQNSNYTLFGLTDGGQDPQAVLTYQGGIVLPEITVAPNENYFYNPYDNIILHQKSNGGKIHIKPENRGKFTRLKERTGHSATWFKEHGTPAQKKMATFALNAKKWKHGDGGNLFAEAGQLGHPYYEYDDNGNLILGADGKPLLTYNARTPLKEVVVTGKKNKGFLEEALDRFKDVNLAYVDNPAVMTTAGQTAKISEIHYPTKEERQLADNLAVIGAAGSIPFAITAAPTVSQGITSLLTNPYFDAAVTSLGGAHAAQSIANGKADWMTALELAPMARLARPMYSAATKLSASLNTKPIKGFLIADDYYNVPDFSTTGLPDFSSMTRAEKYQWLKTQQELAQRVDQTRTMDALRMTKDRLRNGGFDRVKDAAIDDVLGVNPEAYDVTATSDNANAVLDFLDSSKKEILKAKPYRGTSQDISNKVGWQLDTENGGYGAHGKFFTNIFKNYSDFRKSLGLTKGNKDAAHEFVHYMYWPFSRPKGFHFFGPDSEYFSGASMGIGSGEIAARGTQLKNYFGLKEGEVLTPEMWSYAQRHYLKDVGDNAMSSMFNSVNTKSPEHSFFLQWLNKHAPSIVGTGLTTSTTLNYLDNE